MAEDKKNSTPLTSVLILSYPGNRTINFIIYHFI